jgi:hypothetical protein
MRPHSSFPAERRLRFWAILLLAAVISVVISVGIHTSPLLRRQYKLIRLSPRHSQTSAAGLADLKGRSAILKQPEPKPYTVPAEDPRLLAALSGDRDAEYDLGVAYARSGRPSRLYSCFHLAHFGQGKRRSTGRESNS